ncbi:MAG: glycine--tRNA ligase subunit beta [Candidatus Margulisiibacteriota bacterium]
MRPFVFELGVEEVPARFMTDFLNQLKTAAETAFASHRLAATEVRTLGTYRRFVLMANLATEQTGGKTRLRGPQLAAAKGTNGEWLAPAIGFAKKAGIDPDAFVVEEEQGKSYVVAYRDESVAPAVQVLPELLESVVANLPLPIAMKWGHESKAFIRPVHWVLCLHGNTAIPLNLYGIQSKPETWGHRFLADHQPIPVPEATQFETILENAHVVVDPAKRKQAIRKALETHGAQSDEGLLEEVTYLCEWPTVLVESFPDDFLRLPQQALIACMKKHQKYFPILNNGQLTHSFAVVAENVTPKSEANIRKGNRQVLVARLDDVRFFYEEDIKQTLDQHAEKLKTVVFQKGLGTLADKVARIQRLSIQLASFIGKTDPNIEIIARLSKSDLTTQMVYELPELQGKMGAVYARYHRLPEPVSLGIEEHYLPRFAGDSLPTTLAGSVVGIADRLDTIAACFVNGLIPTGSQDPWSIRRMANAILEMNLTLPDWTSFSLTEGLDAAFEGLQTQTGKKDCLDFFKQRVSLFFKELRGFDYDLVDAVMANFAGKPSQQLAALTFLKARRQEPHFKAWVDLGVRVARLVKSEAVSAVEPRLFKDAQEGVALDAFKALFPAGVTPQTVIDHYKPMVQTLIPTLTTYFDQVMVMDPDEGIRANRLAFLSQINGLFKSIGDFEKIVV